MNQFVSSMNDILSQWKNDFDHFSAIPFDFSVMNEFLCFGSLAICQQSVLEEFSSSSYDAEGIQFFFGPNRSIVIAVSWPEDEPPKVSSVAFIQLM